VDYTVCYREVLLIVEDKLRELLPVKPVSFIEVLSKVAGKRLSHPCRGVVKPLRLYVGIEHGDTVKMQQAANH